MRPSIYLASSWRNSTQPTVVRELRYHGYAVYDFRNPSEGWTKKYPGNEESGFHWSSIDPGWESWSPWYFVQALEAPQAVKGYLNDFNAIEQAEVGVLLLPSGRSAHIEAGYFAGHPDKSLHILVPELPEPELMYRMADGIHLTIESLVAALRG